MIDGKYVFLLLNRDSDMDEVEFSRHHAGVKRGDIVGICGYPGLFILKSYYYSKMNWFTYYFMIWTCVLVAKSL